MSGTGPHQHRHWLLKQWGDIKGNVKYGALMALLAVMLGGTNWLLDGLLPHKRALVIFLFGLLVIWAAIASWGHRWRKQAAISKDEEEMLSPLQIEVLRLVRDLGGFVKEVGPKPQAEKKGAHRSSEDLADFLVRQTELERPWHSKLTHGYAGRFAPRVKAVMHKLGEKQIDMVTIGKYAEQINSVEGVGKLLERLYYAILELEPNPFPES